MTDHIITLADLVSRLPKAYSASRQDLMTIRVGNDFEPHGLASEDWEITRTLTLHTVPFHWLSTTGWQQGTTDKGMRFYGRTLDESVDKATKFLAWWARAEEDDHA